MKTSIQFITALIFFLGINTSLTAQWESKGPYAGAMTSLAYDGAKVYAGTMANGVFSSSDDGATWTSANQGLERTWINDVITNSAGVFAGTDYLGVYFSSDQGNSWIARNNGLTDLHITQLFSSRGNIFASTPSGVFFSSNNGISWILRNNGIPGTYPIYTYAQMGDTIYGGTYGKSLYMTDNNGQTWSQVGAGFPSPSSSFFVYSLATSGNTIYAGTSSGIYLSTNRGVSWVHSGNMYMSENYALALAVNGNSLYAGTYAYGIHVSNDNAASFVSSNNGLQWYPGYPTYIQTSEFLGLGSSVLAATYFGMYRTTNNGLNWNNANEGILATDITAIVNNGSAVLAGSNWTGMFSSTDKGLTWNRANNGLPGNFIRCMAVSGNDIFASIQNEKVYRTTDNGASWTWSSYGLPSDPVSMEADNDQVLAITAASKYVPNKLFQTKDKGLSWTEVPSSAIGGGIAAVAINDPYFYAGTYNGMLLRSSNEGGSWSDISSYLPGVKITAILPLDTVTYVGTEGRGIYMFLKNDSYMIPASGGLMHFNITDIIEQDNVLFASTFGGGVYASANGGITWFMFNGGLENPYVRQLSGEPMKIYAGTDAGVYQTGSTAFSELMILAGVNENSNDAAEFFPNPSSGKIHFKTKTGSAVVVEVYDLNGNRIAASSDLSNEGTIDLSSAAKGIYFMKVLSSDKSTVVKKVIIQ